MKKFPINSVEVDVEALGGKIVLTELTQAFRVQCNNDKSFDTPRNGLVNAGLTEDQVDLLGERVAVALYEEVIDLTYPDLREEVNEMIASGTYKAPTNDEIEEAKKNF